MEKILDYCINQFGGQNCDKVLDFIKSNLGGKQTGKILVLQGKQATGKTTFIRFLEYILGEKAILSINAGRYSTKKGKYFFSNDFIKQAHETINFDDLKFIVLDSYHTNIDFLSIKEIATFGFVIEKSKKEKIRYSFLGNLIICSQIEFPYKNDDRFIIINLENPVYTDNLDVVNFSNFDDEKEHFKNWLSVKSENQLGYNPENNSYSFTDKVVSL